MRRSRDAGVSPGKTMIAGINEAGVVMDLLSHRKHNQPDLDALGVGLSNLYPPYGLVFSIR